jgi:hypothetical protein
VSNGIENVKFPEVIAGDDGRAAFAFLGSTTPGDAQQRDFAGAWDMYVAFTYDQGRTWTTVDATPGDPVQRGCIDNAGTIGGACPYRNLLDFNDITVDKQGRVLVGYADGCSRTCDTGGPISRTAIASIVRQSCGRGLFAAYDPGFAVYCPPTGAAAASSPGAGAAPATLPNTGRQALAALFAALVLLLLAITIGTARYHLARAGESNRV